MKKVLAAALLGASMIAVASPAAAVVTLTSSTTVGGVKFLNYNADFMDLGGGVGIVDIPMLTPGLGKFVLTFSFNTPTAGFLNSSGTTVALNKSTDIDFKDLTVVNGNVTTVYKAVSLNGVAGVVSNEAANVGTSMWMWPSGQTVPTVDPNPQILRVAGESFGANANLRGDVSFLAVPEPATWALMILGFGMVGAAMRNRRRGVVAA